MKLRLLYGIIAGTLIAVPAFAQDQPHNRQLDRQMDRQMDRQQPPPQLEQPQERAKTMGAESPEEPAQPDTGNGMVPESDGTGPEYGMDRGGMGPDSAWGRRY